MYSSSSLLALPFDRVKAIAQSLHVAPTHRTDRKDEWVLKILESQIKALAIV